MIYGIEIKENRLNRKLLEFGHHFVDLIVRVGAVGAGVDCFPTQTAGDPFLVEIWTLGGTGAFEFAVLEEYQAYGHQNEE